MTATLSRLRPLLIGIVVLLLTAGIAFAGRPSTPPGHSVAAEAAGKIVPVQAEDEGDEPEAEAEEENEEEEQPLAAPELEAEEAGDNCATDPTTLTETELAELRHGSIVCWAARQETPEGYANHGAWVSEWARQNHGHEDDEEAAAAAETSADDTTAASAHGNGSGKGRAKGGKP